MERIVVSCIIENDKKELLLQKKTLDYTKHPGAWGFFGGEAESEDLNKEMIRELKEEIGIRLNIKQIFVLEIERGKDKTIINVFLAKLNDISKIKIGEGAGVVFFGKEELNKLEFMPDDKSILNKYLKI